MEAVIAIQVLAKQIDTLAVIHPEQLRYNASFMVRGLLELPVRVRRHPGA
jgi:cytochrome P450